MACHIVKYEYENGKPLRPKHTWCEKRIAGFYFTDTHHAALSIDNDDYASGTMCRNCVKVIVKLFNTWLDGGDG